MIEGDDCELWTIDRPLDYVYKRESDHSDSCENCKISSVAGRQTLHILRIKKHNSKENRFFRRPKILRIQGKNEYIEEKLWIWIDKRTSRVADAEKSCDVFYNDFNEKPFYCWRYFCLIMRVEYCQDRCNGVDLITDLQKCVKALSEKIGLFWLLRTLSTTLFTDPTKSEYWRGLE